MLLVRTKLGPSKIHGIGLFADEFIPKGTIIWEFVPGFDLKFTEAEIKNFPEITKDFFHYYAYRSIRTGLYILCSDESRHYNHSESPNTTGIEVEGTEEEGGDIATLDIQTGQEITYNYKDPKEGDSDWQWKLSH
mgnify:FL=1